MNLKLFVLLALFSGLAASLKRDISSLPDILGRVSDWYHETCSGDAQPCGVIKDVIEGIVKQLEGHRTETIEKLEVDESVSFENIKFESNVGKVVLDIEEPRREINIREMVIPVALVDISGLYKFLDKPLPGGLVIYGKGNFTIKFVNLTLSLTLRAKYDIRSGLWNVQDMTVNTSLEDSLIKFENLMDGEPMGDFLNTMVNEFSKILIDLLPGFVEQYKVPIMEQISKIINDILNG